MSQAAIPPDQRRHHAILAPDLVLLVSVPVDLGIHVIAIEPLRTEVEVVAQVAGLLRQRRPIEHLLHRSIYPRCGNDVQPAAARTS